MKGIRTLLVLGLLSGVLCINAQNISRNCYRGYVDAGYAIGVGDYEFNRFEINTSHGYQFNPYLFLGAGTGFHFMSSYKTKIDARDCQVDIPVFANIRCNFSKNKVAPFFDLKGGTYINNNGGMYGNASIGFRVAINEKQAVNLSVGYATEDLEFEDIMGNARLETEAVTLKVGFEF